MPKILSASYRALLAAPKSIQFATAVAIVTAIVLGANYYKARNWEDYCDDDEDYEETGSYTREPITAGEAIKGALANARARYHSRLGSLGLSEIFYDDNAGVAHLVLLGGQYNIRNRILSV